MAWMAALRCLSGYLVLDTMSQVRWRRQAWLLWSWWSLFPRYGALTLLTDTLFCPPPPLEVLGKEAVMCQCAVVVVWFADPISDQQ